MIYVTGDLHGDFSRFKAFSKLTADDILLVCGDFGFIWDGSRREKSLLKKIGKFKYTVAFLDGCHENFDLLEQYEVATWNGGRIRKISGKLIHLTRGQIFTVDGKKIFVFGGGQSPDFEIRRDTHTLSPRELPTVEEIDAAIKKLHDADYTVDYIVTHEPPWSMYSCLNQSPPENLEVHALFDEIMRKCEFNRWYFGKVHENKVIAYKFMALYDSVIPLETPVLTPQTV
jgi:hypothetical protein